MINVFVLIFIVGMGYWWFLQGFFSALLHLLFVIVAGAIAFAVFEPLAHMIAGMGKTFGQFAICIGLLLPFAVCLTILRVVGDKVVGGNLIFQEILDGAGGAVLGVASAVLTVGIFLLAINFTPLSPTFAGYTPYVLQSGANHVQMTENKSVWLSPDRIAANFYSTLSGGAFSPTLSDDTLASAYPDFATVAHYHRAPADENAFRAASPDAVNLTGFAVTDTDTITPMIPEEVRAAVAAPAGQKLVVVTTAWSRAAKGGVYDSGSTLRLSPGSMLLFTNSASGPQIHLPVGWTEAGGFTPFDTNGTVAVGISGQGDEFGFTYLIPAGETPTTLYARGLRLDLRAMTADEDVTQIAAGFGQLGAGGGAGGANIDASVPWITDTAPVRVDPQGTNAGAAWAGALVERTNRLPGAGSVNKIAAGGRVERVDQSREASPGTDAYFVGRGTGSGLVINALAHDDTFTMLRVKVNARAINAEVGSAATQLADSLDPVVEFTDSTGKKWGAVAYAIQEPSTTSEMRVFYSAEPVNFGRELGVELRGDLLKSDTAELYLYFRVPPGREIVSFQLARNEQDVHFYIPLEGEEKPDPNAAGGNAGGNNGNPPPPPDPNNSGIGSDGIVDPATAPGARFGF